MKYEDDGDQIHDIFLRSKVEAMRYLWVTFQTYASLARRISSWGKLSAFDRILLHQISTAVRRQSTHLLL